MFYVFFFFFSDFCLCVLCTCCLFVGRTKLTALATVDVQRRNCSPSSEFGGQRSEVLRRRRQIHEAVQFPAARYGGLLRVQLLHRKCATSSRISVAAADGGAERGFLAHVRSRDTNRFWSFAPRGRRREGNDIYLGGGCIYDDDDTMYSCSRRSPVSKFSDVISRPRQSRNATIQGPRHFLRPGPVPSDLK